MQNYICMLVGVHTIMGLKINQQLLRYTSGLVPVCGRSSNHMVSLAEVRKTPEFSISHAISQCMYFIWPQQRDCAQLSIIESRMKLWCWCPLVDKHSTLLNGPKLCCNFLAKNTANDKFKLINNKTALRNYRFGFFLLRKGCRCNISVATGFNFCV